MRLPRRCTRNGCQETAVATLTYMYSDSTAVVGPLAVPAEPHTYDLCEAHARSLTAPRGWDLVRHDGEFTPPPCSQDDLAALAEAVRESAAPAAVPRPESRARAGDAARPGSRRGHLRVIPAPAIDGGDG